MRELVSAVGGSFGLKDSLNVLLESLEDVANLDGTAETGTINEAEMKSLAVDD